MGSGYLRKPFVWAEWRWGRARGETGAARAWRGVWREAWWGWPPWGAGRMKRMRKRRRRRRKWPPGRCQGPTGSERAGGRRETGSGMARGGYLVGGKNENDTEN